MVITDIFGDFFETGFESFSRRIDRIFEEMDSMGGPAVKTYGYTMYQGPDGVPHYREFGNAADGGLKLTSGGAPEPFSDVVLEDGTVRVTVELPGVSKEDITLESTANSLIVNVDSPRKKFSKTLALPCDVNLDTARAECNNGMLEVTYEVVGKDADRRSIEIL